MNKFHIMDKTFFKYYLPDTDLSDYPEFTIGGKGITVYFEDK